MNVGRGNLFRVAFLGGMVLLMAGCGPEISPEIASERVSVTETQADPTSPAEGEATPMTAPLPTPSDPTLQNLVEKTREDLSKRLSISAAQISLVEVAEVEWSDSSLGCPQAGMDYLQMITPGYRILLGANGQQYEYHSNRAAYFVYCESAMPPISPNP